MFSNARRVLSQNNTRLRLLYFWIAETWGGYKFLEKEARGTDRWRRSRVGVSLQRVVVTHLFLFKGHSELAHMHIRYQFIVSLFFTETRSILFLTKYDKNIIEWAKAHSKTGFSVNDWKSSKTLRKLKWNSRCTLISGWGELFQSEKTVQVSTVPKLCPFNLVGLTEPPPTYANMVRLCFFS